MSDLLGLFRVSRDLCIFMAHLAIKVQKGFKVQKVVAVRMNLLFFPNFTSSIINSMLLILYYSISLKVFFRFNMVSPNRRIMYRIRVFIINFDSFVSE